ncbi:MAG: tyrosine--tRNA ligase [Candidatus Thorarchaeota archaeon]|nr:MAG: tyrosine--tRNA ligase [Candidatus Thorarchaeota archaeon]
MTGETKPKSGTPTVSPEEAVDIIKRMPTEEILTEQTLRGYLEEGVPLTHYIGYEVSGFVHLGTGLLCMQKVTDFQQAGVNTQIFLADYHSWINKKLGGDLSVIRRVAGGYFKEALKWSLKSVGGDPKKSKFIMGSTLYEKLGLDYLESLIKVAMKMTLGRAKRSITVLGRREGEQITFAQLLYVPMQVADIYGLKVNLAHGGMDQRKAHVIAIEVAKNFDYKPVTVHHHLLLGMHVSENQRQQILQAKTAGDRALFEDSIVEVKMSKSRPDSAIFVHDTPEEIKRKLRKSYCPPKETQLNPILDLARFIVWPYLRRVGEELVVENAKTGEVRQFEDWTTFEADYAQGGIHPLDLKNAVGEYLIRMLEPARKYFIDGKGKKHLEEMQSLKTTR